MGNIQSPEPYVVHNQQQDVQPNLRISNNNNNNINNNNNNNPQNIGGGRGGVIVAPAHTIDVTHDRIVGGLRADLASLLSFPYRPNPPPPPIYEATTIKSNVNINKESLHFVRDEQNSNLYRVQFVYDSYTPCSIKLYFIAKETIAGIQARIELPPMSAERGFGIVFNQPIDSTPFDVSMFKPEELTATTASTQFPVVISIHSLPDEPSKSVILSQTTFATLLHCADDSFAIKAVKQKLPYLGQTYNLHDIYGLDYTGERENEGSRECVVCMSEPRDTTILPCNHMCLCAGCAELMRTQTNKCPICRAPVKKLLSIKLANGSEFVPVEAAPAVVPPVVDEAKLQKGKEEEEDSDDGNEDTLLARRERDLL